MGTERREHQEQQDHDVIRVGRREHELTHEEMSILHSMIRTWRFGKWLFIVIVACGSLVTAVYQLKGRLFP